MRWIALSYNVLNFHFPLANARSVPFPLSAQPRVLSFASRRFFLFYCSLCVRECVGGKAAEHRCTVFSEPDVKPKPRKYFRKRRCSAFSIILCRLWCALCAAQPVSLRFFPCCSGAHTCSPRDFSVFGAFRASVCFVFGCQHKTNTHAHGCRCRGELVLWAFALLRSEKLGSLRRK